MTLEHRRRPHHRRKLARHTIHTHGACRGLGNCSSIALVTTSTPLSAAIIGHKRFTNNGACRAHTSIVGHGPRQRVVARGITDVTIGSGNAGLQRAIGACRTILASVWRCGTSSSRVLASPALLALDRRREACNSRKIARRAWHALVDRSCANGFRIRAYGATGAVNGPHLHFCQSKHVVARE